MHEVFVHEFMSTMATLPAKKMLAKVAPLALERANCVWASNKGLLHCTVRFLIHHGGMDATHLQGGQTQEICGWGLRPSTAADPETGQKKNIDLDEKNP